MSNENYYLASKFYPQFLAMKSLITTTLHILWGQGNTFVLNFLHGELKIHSCIISNYLS
jgi:hypothetical protein